MIELRSDFETLKEQEKTVPLSFHPSFQTVCGKLRKWAERFYLAVDNSIFNDLTLLYLLAVKKFLDHRIPSHLFRLALSLHFMQKKLLRSVTFNPHQRHLEIRWIPTHLHFSFSCKPVLGCLIGFNLMDRYELFDEENIILALQKYFPELNLVKESSYSHNSQHRNLKIFYFEIEKKNETSFSLLEQNLLKNNLVDKVKKTIQPLSPAIFMGRNDEEIYKSTLILSQEIQSLQDLPQAFITLDQQTGKEIIFRINLVLISPFHSFSLKERFFECTFVSQLLLTVKHIENHPIEAHIFRLHLPRNPSLLRSDGSLDFYAARQKVANLLKNVIGEFRDYNGGILIKQQELLKAFKENFPSISNNDPEFMEAFFYALAPLEKQAVLPIETLSTLFDYFLKNKNEILVQNANYSFKIYHNEHQIFLIIHGNDASLNAAITTLLNEQDYNRLDIAYNFFVAAESFFFNCILLKSEDKKAEALVHALQESLHKWNQKRKDRQVLRIGLEHPVVSLDPRKGGESASGDVLSLLFEGLTRFSSNSKVENGAALSIEISPNKKQYIFKLRSCLWNDGSPLTAYDFEYAWKKALSPDFQTSFAFMFYPIKNAKAAKEGKISPDEIGIKVLGEKTIMVELVDPTPYFLQFTAHTIYSPIHRFIDQRHPQWPYEHEKNYPCNGPFILKMNQPNQGYQLVKNALYWDADKIALDQITLTHMNPAQALHAFEMKEVDWIGSPFGTWHPSFGITKKEDSILTFPNGLVCWFVFNTSLPPFHNKKLRQAFSYPIQRAQIVADAFLPITPAFSPLLPQYQGNCQNPFPDYNPEMARRLFKEALDELGITKNELSPLNLIFVEKGIREYTAVCLKKQFKECLGIECELKPLNWTNLFHKMTKGQFQMGLINWYSHVDDPIYTLNAFITATEDTNFAKWEHLDFQNLIHLAEKEVNLFQRSSYLLKAEAILSQEMPLTPLFYQPYQALIRNDLQVFFKNPGGPFNIAKTFYKHNKGINYE